MAKASTFLYWDSSVFLAYLNGETGRFSIIESILEDCERAQKKILTSVIARVEVAFIQVERDQGILNPDVEAAIDAFWNNFAVIELIEVHEEIATIARDLLRFSVSKGWGLRPYDAVHLATAQWTAKHLKVTECDTYDSKLNKYANRIGLPIVEPWIAQPKLLKP